MECDQPIGERGRWAGGRVRHAGQHRAPPGHLVYVAAFAPDDRETLDGLLERFPGSTLGPTPSPPVALPDGGPEVSIRPGEFWQQFAADLPETDAKLAAATQRPVSLVAFTDASGPPARKAIPSRFIYGDQDKNIPPALLSLWPNAPVGGRPSRSSGRRTP